jgi:uncharacterized protein
MEHSHTLAAPWYRHRWPWLLMAGPATVIVAGAITTWLAATGNTALVADEYYKQGLTINRTLAHERRADELGAQLRVTATPAEAGNTRLDIELALNEGVAYPPRLRVLLTHPTRSELDRELLLTGADGHYSGLVRDLPPTHWKLVIEDDVRSWRIQKNLVVAPSGIPEKHRG